MADGTRPTNKAAVPHTGDAPGDGDPTRRTLLVVEPEALLRWSLTTYFSRWFSVHTATSVSNATEMIENTRWSVVVVSDNLADGTPDTVERHARDRDQDTLIVRMVTHRAAGTALPDDAKWLEKPFELSDLAAMVGVQPAAITNPDA